jgi:hypothetical protein
MMHMICGGKWLSDGFKLRIFITAGPPLHACIAYAGIGMYVGYISALDGDRYAHLLVLRRQYRNQQVPFRFDTISACPAAAHPRQEHQT